MLRILLFIGIVLGLIYFCNCEEVVISLVIKKVIYLPDGFPRPVTGVFEEGVEKDRPFPGPLIRAKLGDTVSVKVWNRLNVQTSLHFHGVHMFKNPWADGSNGVTDCGIPAGAQFIYSFNVTQTGTYWYHSHTGTQYADGEYGPIVLDYPGSEVDPVKSVYPYSVEHVMMLQDWFHEEAEDLALLYNGPFGSYHGFKPKYPWPPVAILLNGKGHFNCSSYDDCSWLVPSKFPPCSSIPQCIPIRRPFMGECNSTAHEPDQFMCPKDSFIRIRIVNSASNLPLRYWIQSHDLIIVERDGIEVEPTTVSSLTIPVAQRIDVIVKCNQDPSFKYEIRVEIPPVFIPEGANIPDIFASAYLTYSNSSQTLYSVKKNFTEDTTFEYTLKPKEKMMAPPASKRIFLEYQVVWNTTKDSPLEEWTINGISFMKPKQTILSAKMQGIKLGEVINQELGSSGNIRRTHIQTLTQGEVYEIVLIGKDLQQHPWHFHGYDLLFTQAQKVDLSPFIVARDDCNWPIFNLTGFQAKIETLLQPLDQAVPVIAAGDSFTVPGYGFVVFRFKADNPGPWLLHCHVVWHMELGMAVIFSVENADGSYDIYPKPSSYKYCPALSSSLSEQIPPLHSPNMSLVVPLVGMLAVLFLALLILSLPFFQTVVENLFLKQRIV